MKYTIRRGNYDRMGVTIAGDSVIFTFAGEKEDQAVLVFVNKRTGETVNIPVPEDYCLGSLRSVSVSGLKMSRYYYYYEINGQKILDDYAPVIVGREVWNYAARKNRDYHIYGAAIEDHFDWGEDASPEIRGSEMVMYKLHVRGFTMDKGARRPLAGTFEGVESKIPYLKSLGVTTVELMPVYEFEEMPVKRRPSLPDYVSWQEKVEDLIPQVAREQHSDRLNYWGYGPGNYFAVKASYARHPAQAAAEFKHLVAELHRQGMECVMEMYFPAETNHHLILDALRFWVREYHVDGFHLLGDALPMTVIEQDLILSRTKIFCADIPMGEPEGRKYRRLYVYKEEYQYPARKMLNHISADMREFLNQQRKQGRRFGYVNFVASNNGFSLADVFMYNDKHNELNGEENLDGDAWNFSSNYGLEGPTRKKFILESRQRQWRNAMMMLFFAQGVPLIWSGDEFGNSQQGNNNAYCQDNPIGWINWRKSTVSERNRSLIRALVDFRREHPILSAESPFTFTDYRALGLPDLSYHGDSAWISQIDLGRMSVGLFYNGAYAVEKGGCEDVYVAYNFYTYKAKLALPRLPGQRSWYLAIDSADAKCRWMEEEPKLCEQQKYITVEPQSICVLIGR